MRLPFGSKAPKQLNLQLLAITVPQQTKEDAGELVDEIARSEQLFSALLSLEDPFVFEAAVHNISSEIHFYLAVPRANVSYATQQVLALFPEAHVESSPDYTIFSPTSHTAAGYLRLTEKAYLPLRTYQETNSDTFTSFLSVLARLHEVGDGAAIQVIAEPAPERLERDVRSLIERLRKGEKLSALMRESLLTDIAKFGADALSSSAKHKEPEERDPADEEAIQILNRKIEKPLLNVQVRFVVAAEQRDRAEDMLMDLSGATSQLAAPRHNALKLVKPATLTSLLYQFVFRVLDQKQSMVLNTEELASLFHLPVFSTVVPRIHWLTARDAETPLELPREGLILGDSVFRGERTPVRITDEDRRRHVYMVGQTGTGKSTLLKYMARQDIANGKGVCVIDPNGDLIDDLLSTVPTDRLDDVIVFDPGSLQRPLGLNMLEYDFTHPEQKTFIVNEMQSIFNRLFSQETMGPMFEQYMRNALLLLMEDMPNEPATLVEVPRVFTDAQYRARKLARCKNPTVLDFWQKEAEVAGGEMALANMTPYFTSKFGGFIGNDYLRPIIGQEESAFDFREVMDEGKILLVKLPKGRIGDINANLLGMIITGKLLMAALSRDEVPQEDRRDFYLYMDEFQNFTTDSISTILSEARKYRLNLSIAHQFLGQLPDSIKDAVFGNAGTLISFRVGIEDAEGLAKHFAPAFEETDLIALENLHAVIRPLVHGHPKHAFNLAIRFAEGGSPAVREKLIEYARLTYGKPLAEIEEGILKRRAE